MIVNSVGLLLKCKQQPPFAAMYKARVFAYLECNLPYVHSLLISCSLPRGFNKEILKCCYDERNVKPPLTKQLEPGGGLVCTCMISGITSSGEPARFPSSSASDRGRSNTCGPWYHRIRSPRRSSRTRPRPCRWRTPPSGSPDRSQRGRAQR